MDFLTKIKNYKKASYSALFVLTHEENRLSKELLSLCDQDPLLNIHEWDTQRGLIYKRSKREIANDPNNERAPKIMHPSGTEAVTELLKYLQTYRDPVRTIKDSDDDNKSKKEPETSIFVLKDFHLHFDKVLTIRLLRNAWNRLKANGHMIIFVGCKFIVPAELQKEIQLVDYDLPGNDSIRDRLTFIHNSFNKDKNENEQLPLSDEICESAVEAAKGMTSTEIEDAFSLALISARKFNQKFVEAVFQEKIAQLKKNGLLTYMEPNISFDNVGGMQGLKKWLTSRKKAYNKEAREYNLPMPKGMLLASVPGTGKSLICKAIAKEFDCPLFALDIGSIFDSLVGNSEKNMREMIKVVESIGKCVILID